MTKSEFIERTDAATDELQLKAGSILTTLSNIENRQELNPVFNISKYFVVLLHSIAYNNKGLPIYVCNRENFSGLVLAQCLEINLLARHIEWIPKLTVTITKNYYKGPMDIIVNQHAMVSTLYKQTNKSQGTDTIVLINELNKTYNGLFDDNSVLSYFFNLRTIKDPFIAFDCRDDHYYKRSRQEMTDIIQAEPKED